MKTAITLLLSAWSAIPAPGADTVNFMRQKQEDTGVVWDMPLPGDKSLIQAMALERGGACFELWNVAKHTGRESLLDRKLIASSLPYASLKITTLDPCAGRPRTRVDQPFTVEVHVDGLLSGLDFPKSASSVLLERRPVSTTSDNTRDTGKRHVSRACLTSNGDTVLRFEASALTAPDPTKACGEESFVVNALDDGGGVRGSLATATVKVLPVASGAIKGISPGQTFRSGLPAIEMTGKDLYPCSETRLLLFEGSGIHGVTGTEIRRVTMDQAECADTSVRIDDLGANIHSDGTYTLALTSDTVYGRELLCDPVTFRVDHGPQPETNRFPESTMR
jgi:hypothetical protein